MYIFTTTLLGPEAEIEGVFSAAEPQTLNYPGCPKEFAIESITIGTVIFEIDCLCDKTLKQLEQEAFDDVTANQEPF